MQNIKSLVMRAHKPNRLPVLLVLLIMLAIFKGNAIVVYALINRDALLSDRHAPHLDCSWMLDREMRFGQRALDADMPTLAQRYLDRILFMSGQLPCSGGSAHWNNEETTDEEWGQFVVVEGDLTAEELDLFLSMWTWSNKWRLVKSVAGASIERYPGQLFGYYYLAQAWLHEGDVKAALDTYLRAFDVLPDSALLCREIARLYHYRIGDTGSALRWYQASLRLDADEPTALVGAWQLVGDQLQGLTDGQMRRLEAPGWTYGVTRGEPGAFVLCGYTLDEDLYEFSHGVDIEMHAFWSGSQENAPPLSGWFQMGEWWIARERIRNLAPNARFVWDQTTGKAMMPRGYQDLSWGSPALTAHALVHDQRGGQTIVCAQLLNNRWDKTGFYTRPISVNATCYLQAGWIKSSGGGNAYMGYAWLGDALVELDYDYAAGQVNPLDWTHYVRLAIPVPGSQSVRLRLLNNLSNGSVCFNDVLFVPVACR